MKLTCRKHCICNGSGKLFNLTLTHGLLAHLKSFKMSAKSKYNNCMSCTISVIQRSSTRYVIRGTDSQPVVIKPYVQ